MSFTNPLLLAGLIGALLPIIIHLIHKRRPREQKFAAIELVLQSVERVERRWRLRRIILLAARVLLLSALAIAAAGPLLGGANELVTTSSGPTRLAIVVDGSMSMRARYDGVTSLARAVTQARNLVDAMGPEDQALIAVAERRPRLLMERPTPDKATLYRALDAIDASYEHADLGEAVSLATKALGSLSAEETPPEGELPKLAARVVVLSDLAEPAFGAAAELAVPGTQSAAQLELVDVLEGIDREQRKNNAITNVETLNVPGEAPRTVEVRARIVSHAKEASEGPQPRDITLRRGDEDLVAGSVDVVPGTIVDKVMRYAFPEPGRMAVRVVLEADALLEDNVRYAIADVRRQVRMLIVDGAPSGVPKEDEIFYLERALQAGASDQPLPRVITADDLSRADLAAYDVVILAGVPAFARTDGARLADFVEKGGGLMITASEDLDTELYNAELGRVLPRPLRGLKVVDAEAVGSGGIVALANPSLEHPVMEVFSGDALGGLLSTRTSAYLLLQPGASRPMQVLVEYDDGQPAVVEADAGKGRVVLWTTSIDREMSDFAIRPAFVPLMRQLVLRLGQALGRPDTRHTLVGEPRTINVPRGAMALRVTAPDGAETTWEQSELNQATMRFDDTHLPGNYAAHVSFTGAFEPLPSESFVANADTRESDLIPLSVEEATSILTGTSEGATDEQISALARARALTGAMSPETLVGLLLMLMVLAFFVESMITAQRVGR
ncbi:MAG: BatA domain-containing protein [Deltaproteobacteria bacterium]